MAVNKPIQFKRSNTAGKVPAVGQLLVGEIAINTTDKVLYTKDAAGNIVRLAPDVVAPLSLNYAKTDSNVLTLSGTADTGDISTIATKKAVLFTTAPVNAKVGVNYATPKTRILQDIIMVDSNETVREASDSTRALAVYGIGDSGKKENTAYITSSGSVYSNHVTIGKSKTYDTQHMGEASLNINMSKEKAQQSAISIEAFSATNTSKVLSINEGFTITAGQLITSGTAPISSGFDSKDPLAAKYANTWSLYETPQEFVKMYSHVENAAIFGLTATGEVYYTGSVVSGEAGTGLASGYVNVWTKANVEGVDELFISYGTTFARTFDGKWFVSGRAQASVLGAEGSNTQTNTFKQIFSLPANTQKIYYGYGGNGSDYGFVVTADGTLYVRGYNNNGHLLTGNMSQSYSNWTVHPNANFKNPKAISTTGNSTYLVSSTGDLWVGGYIGNSYFLGANADTSGSYIVNPAKIPLVSPVKQLLPGYVTGRVVLENGDLMACGDGNYGFHGISNGTVRTWTKSMEGVDRIYGHRFLLAVKTDGTRWFAGNQALVGDKKTGEIKTWITANTIPSAADYVMTQTVMYAKGGASSRAVHASTAVSGGATIKVTIPSPTAMTGAATQWNTMMIHNGGQAAPIFRIDGLGNVEATAFKVQGQEVYHPGNPMKLADLNARSKTDNVFDSKDGGAPLVIRRYDATGDAECLSVQVEDTVSRIVHNNDEIAASMIFTIKNTDVEKGVGRGDGTKASVHDLVFEGSNMGSKLSLDGNEVYHKGNLTLPDTSNFLDKTTGGYVVGSIGMGEGISTPNQPVYHQLNITRPLDTTRTDSGIVRIESKDDVIFENPQQSLFKVVSNTSKAKNAMSVFRNTAERTFNVNTDGYMFAKNVNTVGITLNGVQGGVAIGTNTATAGQEWFWMAPYIKSADGTTNADFGKELGYQVGPNTWYCEPKLTVTDDLIVGCTDSTRPKIAGFINHKLTVDAKQNGMLIRTNGTSPSTLTLMHDTAANTGTMLRIVSDVTASPNAGAIAVYPNPTATSQGTPSFQVQLDGDMITSGRVNIGAVSVPTQDRLKITAPDDVFALSIANTRAAANSNGIQVALVDTTSDFYTGMLGSTVNFRVKADGQIGTNAGLSALRGISVNYVSSYDGAKTGATGQGSGMVLEPGTTEFATLRFDSDKFRLWAPDGSGTGRGSPVFQVNRLTRNAYVQQALYAQNMVTPIAGATVGGWARGHVIKDMNNIGDDAWTSDMRAMSGFTGTNAQTTSFFVGFGSGGWNATDPASAMHVFPTGSVQTKNGAYGAFSDERLKKNIEPSSPKLADLLDVNVVNFVLKNDLTETKQLGVIAQELETIFPSMVETNSDGIKSVKYSVFTPMLIKAMQEMYSVTVAQDAKIAQLEKEVQRLKDVDTQLNKAVEDIDMFKRQVLQRLDNL